MRVLTLSNWYPPHHYGGYELSCHDVMSRFIERGHDVTVLCSDQRRPDAAPPEPAHEANVRRELGLYIRDGVLLRPSLRSRLAMERANDAALRRALDDVRPDVVSVWHMGAMSVGLLSTLVARGVPVVYAVCDDWPTYVVSQDRWMATFDGGGVRRLVGRAAGAATGLPAAVPDIDPTGAFCFVSDFTRRRCEDMAPWRFSRSTVVFSGIEGTAFAPPVQRPPWRWRLLFCGRYDPRKGLATLVRALALLPSEATLQVVALGPDDERRRIEALAGELGLGDRVHFTSARREELAAHYGDADVFVFPSEWDEPFGLVPLEAMACGTPVAATAVGGSGEFLVDGVNCVRFEAGDHVALAAAVRRLHDDAELRARVVAGGARTAAALDVDALAACFERWHEAAAGGWRELPPDRVLPV